MKRYLVQWCSGVAVLGVVVLGVVVLGVLSLRRRILEEEVCLHFRFPPQILSPIQPSFSPNHNFHKYQPTDGDSDRFLLWQHSLLTCRWRANPWPTRCHPQTLDSKSYDERNQFRKAAAEVQGMRFSFVACSAKLTPSHSRSTTTQERYRDRDT
jgi:hypothetical protein